METNKQGNLLQALSEFKNEHKEQFEIFLDNWEKSGLLEGLNEQEKSIVAWHLEEIATYLLDKNCPLKENIIDVVAFPAARRVLQKDSSKKLNIPEFLAELQFDYAKARVEFNENNKTDMEAEFLANWCDKYVNRNNSKKIALNEERKRWQLLAGIK